MGSKFSVPELLVQDLKLVRLSVLCRPGGHPNIECKIPMNQHPEMRGWADVDAQVFDESVWALHPGRSCWIHPAPGYEPPEFVVTHIPTGARAWPPVQDFNRKPFFQRVGIGPITYQRALDLIYSLTLLVPNFGEALEFVTTYKAHEWAWDDFWSSEPRPTSPLFGLRGRETVVRLVREA